MEPRTYNELVKLCCHFKQKQSKAYSTVYPTEGGGGNIVRNTLKLCCHSEWKQSQAYLTVYPTEGGGGSIVSLGLNLGSEVNLLVMCGL